MKQVFKYIQIPLLVLIVSACESDFLDVNTSPNTSSAADPGLLFTNSVVDYSTNRTIDFGPTGLAVSQLFSGITTSINIVGASGTSNVTQVPYAYFDNVRMGISKIDDVNQSLSFGDNIKPKAHKNLIETYYEDFVSILNNTRKVTAYFLLNERDINNLDFLIPIYIGGELNSYFYINKISDYRPMNGGITKVELILIV